MSLDHSLDHLARAATHELLEQVPPDPEWMLGELKRTRRQRRATRYAAAATAVLLTAGGWTLLQRADGRPDPAELPTVRNGVIVAPPDFAAAGWHEFSSLGGDLEMPSDAAAFARGAFTADGSELVYPGRDHAIHAIDVTTGATRTLADCLDEVCHPALSPDGSHLAYGAKEHLKIQDVDTGETRPVLTPGVTYAGSPTWSPDGRTIAFGGPHGVYTVDVETDEVREIYRYTEDDQLFLAPAWSPDGQTLAFVDPRPRRGDPNDEYSFVVMTVGADGAGPRDVHTAGHCLCLGLPAPTVIWSPDGERLAVAVTQARGGAGIYTTRPDGTEWELLEAGIYGDVDWQPLPG